MRKLIHLLTFSCFLLIGSNSFAQEDKGILSLDEPLTNEIGPGENHRYTVELDANQYVMIRVIQRGVDVEINTYNPAGKKIANFDSPNGTDGPEIVTLLSTKRGKYMVEVLPFNEDGPKQQYDITLELSKPGAVTIEAKVDQLFIPWDNMETPGAAVAIVKGDEVIYKKEYGAANLEYNIPIQSNTIFHVASVSKQFTVFALLLLQEEGLLSLDDDIRKYIPEVPDFGETITLKHLASHTSGLRDQWGLLLLSGQRIDDVITTEHILKLVSRQKELNFKPGEEYYYCNTGFTLLAETVARVSGMTFAEFTQIRIFEPLNMHASLFYDDHQKIVKNRAYSYQGIGEGYVNRRLNYANVGATSLFTTVEDLGLWAINFTAPKVGNASIFKLMNTLVKLNNGDEFGGGLGQFIGIYKGLNQIQHGGADAGYRTHINRFPDQEFAVCVFSNNGSFNPRKLSDEIADLYLSNDFVIPKSKRNKKAEITPVIQEIVDPFDPDKVDLTEFRGKFYSEELETYYTFEVEEDKLIAKHTRASDFELVPRQQDEFHASAFYFGHVVFQRNETGEITGIRVTTGRVRNLLFEKVN